MNNEKIILDEFTELYERSKDDHAAGKFVIVTLPNGDTMVCDVREAR